VLQASSPRDMVELQVTHTSPAMELVLVTPAWRSLYTATLLLFMEIPQWALYQPKAVTATGIPPFSCPLGLKPLLLGSSGEATQTPPALPEARCSSCR
jgi:hypothetical protein